MKKMLVSQKRTLLHGVGWLVGYHLPSTQPFIVYQYSETNVMHFLFSLLRIKGGPISSVDIATGYGLEGPGIESRWGARFSAPLQTGPGAHPASCTMGTGSFPEVESGRGVMLTPHPF
jgi:hypothetical protein